MLTSFQPLIVRTPLLKNEFLLSLVIRLADLNFYSSPSALKNLILETGSRAGHSNDRLEYPTKTETFAMLTALTQLDPVALYNSTYHHFAPILIHPPESPEFIKLSDYGLLPSFPKSKDFLQMRPQANSQFCPKCLGDTTYYSLHWAPTAISVCQRHKCLLVDHCERCKKEISLLAIINARCHRCKADLTKAKVISVADDEIGLLSQRIIQSWFMDNITPKNIASILPEQLPAILYRLVDGLQNCIRGLKDLEWAYLHNIGVELHQVTPWYLEKRANLTTYESYRLYTTACRSIMNWPESFHEFLHHYQNKVIMKHTFIHRRLETGDKEELMSGSIQNNLGNLYNQWILKHWSYPEFTFLQDVFKAYIADNYWLNSSVARTRFSKRNLKLAERVERVSILETSRLLKTTPKTVELLMWSGQLSLQGLEKNANTFLSRSEVLQLNRIWSDQVPLKTVATLLGATKQMATDLFEVGLLYSGRNTAQNISSEQLTRASVVVCLEAISTYIKDFPLRENLVEVTWLDLPDTIELASKLGFDPVTIFLQVSAGQLWAYLPINCHLQLSSLCFSLADVQNCLLRHMHNACSYLSREEAAKYTGIKEAALIRAVRDGLISPTVVCSHIPYFDPYNLNVFMKT